MDFYDALGPISAQVQIDKDINLIPYDPGDDETNTYCQKLLDENYDVIKTMFDNAHSLWEIDD